MSRKKQNGLSIGKFIGFIGAVLTALYALLLLGFFDSIRSELLGLFAASLIGPQILLTIAAFVFAIIGLFAQKRLCMLAAGVLMAVAAFFVARYMYNAADKVLTLRVIEYTVYVSLPAIFLFFAYTEME